MIEIIEYDPVNTLINDPAPIYEFLRFEKVWYSQGRHHKEKQTYMKELTFGRNNNFFWSGLQNRVMKYLDQQGIKYKFTPGDDYDIEEMEPKLKGIKFREDQKYALESIKKNKRGVWQAPTGSGKTILMAGVASQFNTTIMIIVHTKAVFDQTVEEMQKFFPTTRIGQIKSGKFDFQDITVCMKASLCNRLKRVDSDFNNLWGVVIVDECHHVSTMGGEYARVLSAIKAPIRVGFTATTPKDNEAHMCMEGLLGPVLGETSYGELNKDSVLAKPKMRFLKTHETDEWKYKYYRKSSGYHDVYEEGIVLNEKRNEQIIKATKEYVDKGLTVLIMIERVLHGETLYELFEKDSPGLAAFVYGDTDDEVIEKEKESFRAKTRKVVIATRIWSEGLNIKTIGVVINGVGGDSEIAAIQRFGRGFRKEGDKENIILVDFLDVNHEWFMKHSIDRVCYYSSWGWL